MGTDRGKAYYRAKTDRTGEDEKGKYIIYRISKEVYCDCHKETCCHFDGTVMKHYDEKVYVA
tara:strand:+ start:415 stop:600 length:186 start_codon:yes stop_codon:yes gene_type:complete